MANTKETMTELFKSSYSDLHRFVLRYVRNAETTNDIVQEAYLRACQNVDKMTEPRAFLFTTAKNLALDSCRHDKIAKTEPRGDFDIVMSDDEPLDDLLIAAQRSDILLTIVNRMPKMRRTIFSQRMFYGWSYRQIAKHHHLAEKTVEHHIATGLREATAYFRKYHHKG